MYPDFHIQHEFKIPALHDLSRARPCQWCCSRCVV